jgi:hypothetical protein
VGKGAACNFEAKQGRLFVLGRKAHYKVEIPARQSHFAVIRIGVQRGLVPDHVVDHILRVHEPPAPSIRPIPFDLSMIGSGPRLKQVPDAQRNAKQGFIGWLLGRLLHLVLEYWNGAIRKQRLQFGD